MRKILLSIIVLTAAIGTTKAQTDYCKDIKKYGAMFTTPLPNWKSPDAAIQISFGKNGSTIEVSFTNNATELSATLTDVSVQFDDGSKTDYHGLPTTALPKGYGAYTVHFAASNSEMDKFRTVKVKTVTMMGQTSAPFTDAYKAKIMGYANCPTFASDPYNTAVSMANGAGNPASSSGAAAEKTTYTTKPIEAFWGIKFGSTQDEGKKIVESKGGKFSADGSSPDRKAFTDVVFTGRAIDALNLRYIDNKFYEAVLMFPVLEETAVMSTFNTIKKELDDVYGHSDIYADYQYPYKADDGFTVQAINMGKVTYAAKWTSSNGNTIQMQINKDLSLALFYSDSTLKKATVVKKSSDY